MALKPTSLVVSAKVMADVDASQSMKLKVPADAVQKGVGDDAIYSWVELFRVVSSDVEFDKKHKEWHLFTIKLKVPDTTPFPTNAGRTFTQWYRVNPAALSNTDHDDYKFSIINLGRLKMLARACGFELPEGADVDVLPYFITNGPEEPAPIMGMNIFARMTDKPGEDKDGNKLRRQEPTKFVSEADGGNL